MSSFAQRRRDRKEREDYHHKHCSCCGSPITNEDFLRRQKKDMNLTEGATCEGCVRENAITIIDNLGPEIREALSDKNREKWDDLSMGDKVLIVVKLINEGAVSGGSMGKIQTLKLRLILDLLDSEEKC